MRKRVLRGWGTFMCEREEECPLSCFRCGAYLSDEQSSCPRCGYAVAGRVPATEAFAPVAAVDGVGIAVAPVLPTPAVAPPPPPVNLSGPPTMPAPDWESAAMQPFQFAGDWYMRRADGAVGRWDGPTQAWAWQAAGSLPFFMRRPRFSSLKTSATWIYAAAVALVLASMFAVFADIDQVRVLSRVERGEFVAPGEVGGSEELYDSAKGFQGVAFVALGGLVLWWIRRATCNVRSLGARDARLGPWAAIIWWFIPIASLFQPFRVVRQAWRAADPLLPLDETTAYASRPIPPLLWAWWLVYIFVTGAWAVMINTRDEADSPGAVLDVMRVAIGLDAAFIAVAVLSTLVVLALTRRQEVANARFNLPSGLDRVPPPLP